MRTFIAVEITGETATAMTEYLEHLRRHPAKVRWSRPDQMHLTLKFLGEIQESVAGTVSEALKALAAGSSPFQAELKGLGGFPNLKRPNVLWAGVTDGAAELVALAEQVEREMESLGFKREGRPFRPHLTLGRVKLNKDLGAVCAQMEKDAGRSFGVFPVGEMVLFKSVLSPSGADYTALGRFKLGAGA
jgi:2'-5' RNA ligase